MTNFKEKEQFFFEKTNSKLITDEGIVHIQFTGYGNLTALPGLLKDYDEFLEIDSVFVVTVTEFWTMFECSVATYLGLVDYYWSLWGE